MSEEDTGDSSVLADLRKQYNELRKQHKAAQAEIERLTPFEAQAVELEAQVAGLTGDLDGLKNEHAIDLKLARKGFDDPGSLVAKALHKAAGEDAPPFSEWLDSLEGENIPKPLVPYLLQPEPVQAQAAPEQAPPEPPPRQPAPRPGSEADPSTPPAASVTPEALRQASEAFRRNPNPQTRAALETLSQASRAAGFE